MRYLSYVRRSIYSRVLATLQHFIATARHQVRLRDKNWMNICRYVTLNMPEYYPGHSHLLRKGKRHFAIECNDGAIVGRGLRVEPE